VGAVSGRTARKRGHVECLNSFRLQYQNAIEFFFIISYPTYHRYNTNEEVRYKNTNFRAGSPKYSPKYTSLSLRIATNLRESKFLQLLLNPKLLHIITDECHVCIGFQCILLKKVSKCNYLVDSQIFLLL
jgi:hypothetical protein